MIHALQQRWVAERILLGQTMGQPLQQIAATSTVQPGRDHGQATLAPSAVVLSAVGDVRLSDAAGEPIPPEEYAQLLKQLVLEQLELDPDEEEEQPPQCTLKVVLFPKGTAVHVQESRSQLALGGYAQPQHVASESLQRPSWAFEFSWTGSPPTAEQLQAPFKRMAKMWLHANPLPPAPNHHQRQQQQQGDPTLPELLVMVPVQPAGSDQQQQQQPQRIAQAVPLQQQQQGQQPQQLLAGTLENLLAFYKRPSTYEPHVTPAAAVDTAPPTAGAEPAAAEGSAAAAEAPTPGGRKLLRVKRVRSPGIPSQTDLQGGVGGAQLGGSSSPQAAVTGKQGGGGGGACFDGGCSPRLGRGGELLPPAKRPRTQPGTGCRAAAAALALVAEVQGAPPFQSPGPAVPQQPVADGACHVARDTPSSPSLPAIPSQSSSAPKASNHAWGAAAAAAAAAAHSLYHHQQKHSPLGQVAARVVPLEPPAGSSLQRAGSPVKSPGAPCAPCSTPGAPGSSSEHGMQPQLLAGGGPGVSGDAGGVWVAVGADPAAAAAGPAPGKEAGQHKPDPLGAGKLCFVLQRPDKQRLRPRMQLFKPCAPGPAGGGPQPDCTPAGGDPATQEATAAAAAAAAAPRTVPGRAMPAGAGGCLPGQAPGQQQLRASSRLRCFEVRCMVLALDQQQAEAAVQVSSDVILCQTSVRPISTPPGDHGPEPHSSPAAVALLSSSGSAPGSMPAAAAEQQEVVPLPSAPGSPAKSPAKGAAAAAPSLAAHQQDAAGGLPPPGAAPGQAVAGTVEPQTGQQPRAAAAGAGPFAVPPPAVATPANAAAAVFLSAPPSGHQNAAAALAVDPGGAQAVPGTPAADPAAPPSTQQRQGQQPIAAADAPPQQQQQQQQQPAPLVPTWPLSGDTGMFPGLSPGNPVAVEFSETDHLLDEPMGQLQLRVLSGKGKGGQGAVFEAEVAGYSGSNKALQELNKQSDSVQRRVALKVLLRFSDLSEQAAVGWSAGGWLLAGLRSFSVEVEAAQRCEVRDPSGYVLRVHAIGRVPMFTGQPGGEWQPRPALILEYAAGGTVRDQLEAHGGKLDWDPQQASHKAWVVAKRMLRGLRVASKSQVVHRDCKPENVFLLKQDDLESAKMGDFGYSFLAEEAGSRGTTLVYTPGYEAPEVIGKMSYGTEMDVWMLGCSLLTMLTGQEPFYHAAQLPAKERAALRCGSELVRADSPYCDPNHPDYDQVGRHLTKTERETLQKLLEPDHRYRILLRQVNALPYFIYGPSGQFVQAEPFKA